MRTVDASVSDRRTRMRRAAAREVERRDTTMSHTPGSRRASSMRADARRENRIVASCARAPRPTHGARTRRLDAIREKRAACRMCRYPCRARRVARGASAEGQARGVQRLRRTCRSMSTRGTARTYTRRAHALWLCAVVRGDVKRLGPIKSARLRESSFDAPHYILITIHMSK